MTLIFLFLGLLSISFNFVNPFDGLFIIFLRLTPIVLLLHIEHLVHTKGVSSNYIPTINIVLVLMFPMLIIAGYQFIILNKISDGIKSIPGNAHLFCGFLVAFNLFLSLDFKYRWPLLFKLLALTSILFFIVADYKLGLLSLIIAFLLTNPFYKNFIFKKVYWIPILGSAAFISICIIYFEHLLPFLPKKFQVLARFFGEIDSVFDVSKVTLATLELPKGYIQLYSNIFSDMKNIVFGVGPGNYCTNIAILKEKSNALAYCINFEKTLIEMGYHRGTFQDRSNAIINLFAEFGIISSTFYFLILYKILKKPLALIKNLNPREIRPDITNKLKAYLFYLIFIGLQLPFFSIFESSFYICTLGCLYGAFYTSILKGQVLNAKENIIS